VRDDQRRALAGDPLQRGEDLGLHPGVERAGGVVEQQHPRVGEQRAGQRDPLPLAARQGQSLLTDDGGVAVGQGPDEGVRLRHPRGRLHLRVGRVRDAVGDVVPHAGREQERLLRHHPDLCPQRRQRDVADVGAVEPDGTGLHVVETRHEQAEGALTRPARPHQGHRLAGLDDQVHAVEDRARRDVAEAHAAQLHPPLDPSQLVGAGGVEDRRRGVDDLQHPGHPGAGLLGDREQPGQDPDGRDELGQIGGEGEEGPDREPPVRHQQATREQHADLTECRDRLQRRGEAGGQPHRAQPPGVEHLGGGRQPAELPVLLAEALHHSHARHVLLDHPGDLAGLLLCVPGRGEQPHPAAPSDHRQGRTDEQRDEGQQRREHGHHPEREDEQQRLPGEVGQKGEQPLHQGDVAARPADELAGVELVLAGGVQALQRGEHVVAQVELHVQAEPPTGVAAQERQAEPCQAGDDQQHDVRRERAGAVRGRIVDHPAGEQRDGGGDHRAQQRRAEGEQRVAPVPPDVADQPAQPPLPPACRHQPCLPLRRGRHPLADRHLGAALPARCREPRERPRCWPPREVPLHRVTPAGGEHQQGRGVLHPSAMTRSPSPWASAWVMKSG